AALPSVTVTETVPGGTVFVTSTSLVSQQETQGAALPSVTVTITVPGGTVFVTSTSFVSQQETQGAVLPSVTVTETVPGGTVFMTSTSFLSELEIQSLTNLASDEPENTLADFGTILENTSSISYTSTTSELDFNFSPSTYATESGNFVSRTIVTITEAIPATTLYTTVTSYLSDLETPSSLIDSQRDFEPAQTSSYLKTSNPTYILQQGPTSYDGTGVGVRL
ncbi:hypothetical protein AYI68_g4416, partial [Smittium mucronatum]